MLKECVSCVGARANVLHWVGFVCWLADLLTLQEIAGFNRCRLIILLEFGKYRVAYSGLRLVISGDFHHKCACGLLNANFLYILLCVVVLFFRLVIVICIIVWSCLNVRCNIRAITFLVTVLQFVLATIAIISFCLWFCVRRCR
jgi:hypothetical protein